MVKVIAILILTAFPVVASASDRVVVRDSVSASQRDELIGRLRAITGWEELAVGDDGILQTGKTSPESGSRSARELLRRAMSGSRVILLEDASSRKDVVFCRVVLGKLVSEPAAEVHVVLIDFDDFRQVSGDERARAAFNVGWAVLHEIDHVVEDSQDAKHLTSIGECETHINAMRSELGLPTRNSYFFTFLPLKNDPNFVSRYVRLGFDHVNPNSTKKKRYWLIWDAAIVGGLNADYTETAALTVSLSSSPPGSSR